ncbi:MAG: nucleotide-disulfide oxidoreductase [Alphaproteobacteria bacterium]|nr:nucleotide-disulfide oxidoreductase [Alphaproteobacteria bacterium]
MKILILGGGFGGVYCAKKLQQIKKSYMDVELISDNNYFIFQPLLPEVASGTISASDAVTPIRQMLPNVKFRNAEIQYIDLKNKNIKILQGFRRRQHKIDYDHLVIALGQECNLEIIPGLKHHSLTMRNLHDAYNVRNHILQCLELADVTQDAKLKKRLLNMVVVGGGFSGVETVGELKEMTDRLLPFYKNINEEELKFFIVEYSKNLLPELGNDIGDYTQKVFKKRKIKIYLKTALKEVSKYNAILSNGKTIETNTLISTIGSVATKIVKKSSLPLKYGRIITDEFLQVKGFSNVWALGDAAIVPNSSNVKDEYSPPTAQFAVRQAKNLAKNIVLKSKSRNLRKFKYTSKGSLASLGFKVGVGKVFFFTIKGLLGWIIWRAFYLTFIPSFSTKIRVLFNWILEFFVPRKAVLTESLNKKSVSYEVYKKGDIVFEEGMIADGFYIVQTGEFENIFRKTKNGKIFKKTYKVGSHFGSRVILEGGRRTGTITAKKNSIVLKIEKDSFKVLAENFPVLNKYFNNYLPKTFKTLSLKELNENF